MPTNISPAAATHPTGVGARSGAPTLLLFPTALEERRFRDQGGLPQGYALAAVCGFGPVAAGARTAQLLARIKPSKVVLIGIAGSYDIQAHPVGTALVFGRVAIDGVGVGAGENFHGPPALGFPQWPGSVDDGTPEIHDVLELAADDSEAPTGPLLLTTCAASDSAAHAAERLTRFPEAVAEDMEGFAVALACSLFGLPLRILRGLSNEVGDRDSHNWRIPQALAAARRLLLDEFGAADEA